jgi:hypothetical protein
MGEKEISMPSAGLPIENLLLSKNDEENRGMCVVLEADAARAMELHMFTEWLESFVGAWNATHNLAQASAAGIIEWDM